MKGGTVARVVLGPVTGLVIASTAFADVPVTDQPYIRHDGGTDAAIARCNDDDPAAGTSRFPQNEPSVAINPDEPTFIVAGANDYCAGWLGLYTSDDGGQSWTDSQLPGYPGDTSQEGQASPLFSRAFDGSDPVMDWDLDGRLFYGGISLNFQRPNNGDIHVSTFSRDLGAPLGVDYLRTVIAGRGTPSPFPSGQFNDKPGLKVDDWETSPQEGNVYVAWDNVHGFTSPSNTRFSRSTDHGRTFSKPVALTQGASRSSGYFVGPDIAVAPDGTIYVVWRQFALDIGGRASVPDAILFAKSTDGGRTFTKPEVVKAITPYQPFDSAGGFLAGDCGDGPFLCESGFVFHRIFDLPQATVDADGNVYVSWEQLAPVPSNGDTYGPDGQSQAVVAKSTDGGQHWDTPTPADPQPSGHQWWPHLEFDQSTGELALIYYDSRADPSYSPYRPVGNLADGTSVCGSPIGATPCNVLNAFIATSTDGVNWSSTKVSSVGHQPQYEMFGANDVPFLGDYLGIDAVGGTVYGAWTDNRDVVPGSDPREATQDGFDVLQCRTPPSYTEDTCRNAGGANQNIYGASLP